jgi:hypothetical protein
MSFEEFIRTKYIGKFYRPYADFLGNIHLFIEGKLIDEPEFARFFTPLTERDFIYIDGQKMSLLALSENIYRQYPTRLYVKWAEFLSTSEDEVIGRKPNVNNEVASEVHAPDLLESIEEVYHFKNPLFLLFRAKVTSNPENIGFRETIEDAETIANLLIEKDRQRYNQYLEMQKPKEIFLSHKTADKPLVREVATTLAAIGYSTWLDEDKMKAGANLERALRKGFADSCAAVFFLTSNFKDEGYLATEIDYAISEKRARGDRFSIITLMIEDNSGATAEIPHLLQSYVWKRVKHIEIIRAIVEALPIQFENLVWKY